jgi:hypothetical protein
VAADTFIHGAAEMMTASNNAFIFDIPPSLQRSHGTGRELAASALRRTHSLSSVLLHVSS